MVKHNWQTAQALQLLPSRNLQCFPPILLPLKSVSCALQLNPTFLSSLLIFHYSQTMLIFEFFLPTHCPTVHHLTLLLQFYRNRMLTSTGPHYTQQIPLFSKQDNRHKLGSQPRVSSCKVLPLHNFPPRIPPLQCKPEGMRFTRG